MNISQGLKEKNRLAGQIATLKNRLEACSQASFVEVVPLSAEEQDARVAAHRAKVGQLLEQLEALTKKLVSLKGALARANGGIATQLAYLAELKGQKTSVARLVGCKSERLISVSKRDESCIYKVVPYTEEEGYELLAEGQKEIDRVQDKIDAYNATTQIDYEP